ncbi:NADH dehydrogenase 1 alpha subcomplex assembly factor 3 [Lactifluus volemus]|nr:NADH dehydrogenase 1 alpha subcomplex assembly factor 3 [Lactifluus volemus]
MLSLSSILRCSKASSRALHTARVLRNQKWSQLTNILAGEIPPPVQVKSISTEGLLLQDGRLFPSACIFLEGEVILWDVPPTLWSGWDESRFEIFDVVVPKPEILLIGTGKSVNPLPAALRRYLNKLGIQVDIMDSWNACTTYNLLSEEGRRVAAALLPLRYRSWKTAS